MHRMAAALAALALVAGCDAVPDIGTPDASTQATSCDFDCTLDRHVRAIQGHDFAAFEPTVTQGQEIELILPDGSLVSGRRNYLGMLRNILSAGGYQFNYRVIRKRAGEEMGYALLDVRQFNEGVPQPSRYRLLLIFARQNGEWGLVHDQISPYPRPPDVPGGNG